MTDDWSYVVIPFATLSQKGFGFPSAAFESNKLKKFQFLMNFGNWDYWIDDISFYRKKP
ncbi:MAG: hypothetical protein QM756_45260 [Polyangiaceae bacterium]